MRRLDSALLATLGVLISHEIAYLSSSAVGYESSIAHGHMKVAWLVGSGALLAALSRSLISSLRRRSYEVDNVLSLAGAIGGGYFLMEQFERAIDGYGALDLFVEPVFWFGLAVAPLVALVLSWSLRSVNNAVARFVSSLSEVPTRTLGSDCSLQATSTSLPSFAPLSFSVCRRGPPLVSALP